LEERAGDGLLTITLDSAAADNFGSCNECGENNILDSTLKICFDCWCILDVKASEQEKEEE
jgi:hypothetical protein